MSDSSRRLWRALIGLAVLVATVVTAPSAAAQPRTGVDKASITGIQFETLHPADVVAGAANDLLLQWTAGQPLADGTVRITFPGSWWSTPLSPVDSGMSSHMAPGSFSVRPFGDIPLDPAVVPQPACAALPYSTPAPFDVETSGDDQVVVISHVSCAAGQSLAVLIRGAQAPTSVGHRAATYDLPVTASDAGAVRLSVARLHVVPPPRVNLQIETPAQVTAGVPFLARVTALRPNGTVDRHYRGTVVLVSSDCTMDPISDAPAATFSSADRGTLYVSVTLSISGEYAAHRLQVYDIANQARPAVSNYFEVDGFVPILTCPVSYH